MSRRGLSSAHSGSRALNEIPKRQSRVKSADEDCGAPIIAEENHGGVMKQPYNV